LPKPIRPQGGGAVLVFVIPLRNPETSQNWDQCNSLCQQTVRSALAQTDANVRVIVVCKKFETDIKDERLIIMRRPFETPRNSWEAQHVDKYLKIAHGLVEARRFAPCYVMKLDADDLVHRRLASKVHASGHTPGYYIPRGYRWGEGSRFVRRVDDFHLQCGSSNILWCEKHQLPSRTDDDMSAYAIMRLGHNIAVSTFEKLGTPLQPIALRSVIYRVGHGENITSSLAPAGTTHVKPNWKFWAGQVLKLSELRPLTRSLRHNFFGRR
jgi:hypothetical protein